MVWKVIITVWGIIITVAIIVQLVCIGTLSRDLRESETLVKAYDTKLVDRDIKNLRYNVLVTSNNFYLTQKYLNAITKGEYARYLKAQFIPLEDGYPGNEKNYVYK